MTATIRLEVSVDDQRLDLFQGDALIRSYPVSTAAKGVGTQEGSFRTPTGRFAIRGKIGEGAPAGTCFKAREAVGCWHPGEACEDDMILTRILRLDGLDPENANTYDRFIYIHGTNREDLIGTPASHGCIRLANSDMIELFDLVPDGAELIIHPPSRKRGKLVFFDCDSTLSSIEGIDELARFKGDEVFARVVALTDAAMNGDVPLDEVFPRRMEIISPDKAACEAVAALYRKTVTPGAVALIRELKDAGWFPVILSGGFAPLIEPLARDLGIDHVEAVPLYLDEQGGYAGYGATYPTTRNMGKNEVIRQWREAFLPERVVMVGDGISDLETKGDADLFIGFGGVAARPRVKEGADVWLEEMADFVTIKEILTRPIP